MNGLQPMPLFEPKADPTNTSARWTQWIQRFNTYLVASNVKDTARKRALLLYQAGPEVHEIFKTLPDRAFFNYITGGAKAPQPPRCHPHSTILPPPSQSPFSLKYKQNMEFRREV